MEDSVPPLQDAAVDLDLLDELLSGPVFDCPELLQTSICPSSGPFISSSLSAVIGASSCSTNPMPFSTVDYQVDGERPIFSMDGMQMEMLDVGQSINLNPLRLTPFSIDRGEKEGDGLSFVPDSTCRIQPKNPIFTVGQRLNHALKNIKESQKDGDVLLQIWVPVIRENRQVLTTCDQPFLLDFNCQRLVNYRSISTRYQFLADEDSHEAVGLPGRVFLGKLPEWTPDVRYFSSHEYPRVIAAQLYDVRGTIALPFFEKDNRSCLGVIELVMTKQKANCSSDIESICSALQAVDLRSSEVMSIPCLKMPGDSYQVALPEIHMVLRAACESHRLPLAQTWISCIQQGKKGNRHSEENFKACISTVDAACYVQDPCMMAFQQACSEHHLLRGQGIAGKAFMTNQPCFSSDITNFIKTEYPLSHHAKLFNLRAAVAIRLRCIHTGEVDFVLEFFLPVHCIDFEEQKLILNSLSITIQQVCQTLRIVTIRELKDETKLEIPSTNFSDKPVSEIGHSFPVTDKDLTVKAPAVGSTVKVSSWDGKMASLQNLSKNIPQSTLMGHTKQEFDGFSFSAHWDPTDADVHTENVFPEFKQHHGDSNNDHTVSSSTETMKRAAEKRRTKSEKTVSLQELQKYFAGSLKDAARSLGVCPTTLKRICRQHGITRWPSRKIKKVGHSLRKLQVVIDSVHGGAGAFQFSSLYENFIKTTCSDNNLATDAACVLVNNIDHPDTSNVNQQLEGRFSSHTSGSHSLSSSSCSQNSNSSHGCSSEQKQCTNPNDFASGQATSVEKKLSRLLEKVENGVELYSLTEEEPKSVVRLRPEGQNLQTDHHFLGKMSPLPMNRSDFHKIKANFGEEKVILRLHPAWRFQDLKQEIRRRFNIADTTLVDIKYMDDDSEWVLITCDEDLMECIEVCKSTNAHSIKLSVFPVVQPTTRSSLASTALS